jgi:hypothetical protein
MMSFADLDAIERHGWPIAGEKAYPLALKAIPNENFPQPPTASDIAWMAAALRVIPGFLNQQMRADRGLPRPAQANFSLPDVHGGRQIFLRYPARELGSIVETEEPELEAFISDWHWDEQSHEFARQMGRFLFQFFDSLEESNLSDKTIRKHENNCWLIGHFETSSDHNEPFSPAILLNGSWFVGEFEHKVSDAESAVSSYEATWRKLEKYVRARGYSDT